MADGVIPAFPKIIKELSHFEGKHTHTSHTHMPIDINHISDITPQSNGNPIKSGNSVSTKCCVCGWYFSTLYVPIWD